ncbi:LPS export ABC transporter periplasmic protein LptC [Campylobacter sp. RM16188]|uniref:LPS export ABC transporter periplasmic protein LptC n=1 Tax=Campylobacter sp. RM16188 TaxID=1705725 RepID=UPI001553FA19|nr:LPS export ABC transporter periplasmic protein LptC [Campylobacter sp. RM16188]
MVIKIFYFVISIFSVAMVYLTIQDPYHAQSIKPDNSIASMKINDVIDYELNSTIINARYEADEWNRYSDKDEFLSFKAEIIKDNKEHNLTSDKAFYQNDTIKFKGNVDYISSDGLKFVSDEVVYDIKSKLAVSDTSFVMTQNGDKVVGDALVYDTNLKRTYVKGIRAWIEEKR